MPLGAAGGALVISNPACTLVRNLYLKRNGSFTHSLFFLQKKEWEKKENSDQVSLRFAGVPPAAESTGQARCRVARSPRVALGLAPPAGSDRDAPIRPHPSSFSPAMPAAMRITHTTWGAESVSRKSSAPSTVVPTIPSPVHMA